LRARGDQAELPDDSAGASLMPEIAVPEIRLPKVELRKPDRPTVDVSKAARPNIHWPEGLRRMTAEDVGRAMPDVRLPKVDLSNVELPKVELPEVEVELPKKLELPKVEIRRKRSGPPWLLLAVIAAVVAASWMVVTSPATGPRVRRWLGGARQRAEHWADEMAGRREQGESSLETRAFPAAEAADVQPNAYADDLPTGQTGLSDRPRPLQEGIGGEPA
jgi:hypothetical protein